MNETQLLIYLYRIAEILKAMNTNKLSENLSEQLMDKLNDELGKI